MELSSVLGIGCGGCGNNQLDTFLSLDIRLNGIFMNTNLSEMENLKHFDRERRCWYIANADGSGKDRGVTEKYIKEDASKFAELIVKYPERYTIIFGSMDGGTGSKALTMLPRIIKKSSPDKSVNIVATFPSMTEGEISYENTIETWNELLELKAKGLIDSLQFIDNNKGSEKEVNIGAMNELISSMGIELVGNKVDGSDVRKAHTSKGYKVILRLDENITDVDKAIDNSIKNSFFFMPENYECDVIVGNINVKSHNIKDIKDKLEAFDFSKFNERETGDSIILLGGCEMPVEGIQLTKECLREVRKRKRERVVKEDLFVNVNKKDDEEDIVKTTEQKSKLSSKDLNDMFNDDSFWN